MDIDYILNPNHVGEELRDKVFIRHNKRDLGGYNTFVLQPSFVASDASDGFFNNIIDIFVRIQPTRGDRASLLSKASIAKRDYLESLAIVREGISVYSDGNTIVAWYWDGGTGILFFAHGGKAVINLDSRKEFGWQWVSW